MEWSVKFLGKHLFFPVIIRVCQLARINQYLFYRIMWVMAFIYFVTDSISNGYWIWSGVLALFFAFLLTLLLVKWDSWSPPNVFVVKLFVFFLIFGLVINTLAGILSEAPFWEFMELYTNDTGMWCMTFAEFALLLDTIPPQEVKEKAKSMKKATDAA